MRSFDSLNSRVRWGAVLAAAVGVSAGVAALPLFTIGLFMVPLKTHFGWSPADVGLAGTFLYLGLLLSAFWCGRLVDRFGPRPVAVASAAAVAALLAILSVGLEGIAWFYICFFAVGFLGAGTTTISYAKAITVTFSEKRGLALGLVIAGGSVAGIAGPPVVESLIVHHGWRAAFLAEALWALIPIPLILMFIAPLSTQKTVRRLHFERASRFWASRAFVLMSIANLLQAVAVSGMIIHASPILTQLGFDREFVTTVVSAGALGALLGRVAGGYLLDVVPGHLLGSALMLLGALAVAGTGLGLNAAACYFIFGICVGSEGDVVAYLCSKAFPQGLYAKIYGSLYAFAVAGLALGPFLVRVFLSYAGSYWVIVFGSAGLLAISSVLFLALGDLSERGRSAVPAE